MSLLEKIVVVVVAIPVGSLIVYIFVRVGAAAWFRTKEDFSKSTQKKG
jgi:hypothetical protein